MNNLIKIFIIVALIINLVLFFSFDKDTYVYVPVMYWGVGGIIILFLTVFSMQLNQTIKKNYPNLYDKYSILGFTLPNYVFQDQAFLAKLDEEEKQLIEKRKKLFYYFFICFILFAFSAFSVFLK